MGCCSSKNAILEPLKKYSKLWSAQQMKVTPSGHEICQKVSTKVLTQKEADRILADESTPDDFKIIFGQPFCVCNRLKEFLYLTGLGGLVKENIERLDIKLIINATYEWPLFKLNGIMTFRVPVDDGEGDDISIYFDEVSDKIEECRQLGCRVLVHCMAGASRLTTLVLAYLIKHQNINLKNAFKSVKKRRETARPNIGFWKQLIDYEIRIRGTSSVRMSRISQSGFWVTVPEFYKTDYPSLYQKEIEKQIALQTSKISDVLSPTKSQRQFNTSSLTYESKVTDRQTVRTQVL